MMIFSECLIPCLGSAKEADRHVVPESGSPRGRDRAHPPPARPGGSCPAKFFQAHHGPDVHSLAQCGGSWSTGCSGNAHWRSRMQFRLGYHRCCHVPDGIKGERSLALRTVRDIREALRWMRPMQSLRMLCRASCYRLSVLDLERIRLHLLQTSDLVIEPRLSRQDYLGAICIFMLVFFCTLPVVVPFMLCRMQAWR